MNFTSPRMGKAMTAIRRGEVGGLGGHVNLGELASPKYARELARDGRLSPDGAIVQALWVDAADTEKNLREERQR